MKAHLDLDNPHNTVEDGKFVWAKNIVVQKDGSVVNEDGAKLSLSGGSGYYFNGRITLANGYVAFFTSGTNTKIVRHENGVSTTVIDTQYLKTSLYAPIRGVASYNAQGQLRIIFWDGLENHSHKPCFLNLDNLPFTVDSVYELTDPAQIIKIYLFPDYNIPNIEIVSITDGGSIKTGKYQYLIKYEINYGDYTDYTLPTRDVWIADIKESDMPPGWPSDHSTAMGTYASKIVNFEIQNLDVRYSNAVLCAIQDLGTTKNYIEIERFAIPSDGSPVYISHSGQQIETLTTIGDVVSSVKFDRIHTGVLNNKRLNIAHFKIKDRLNYQKYANNIKLGWTAAPLNELGDWATPYKYAYANGRTIFYNRGFMPDEVYAFYIHFVYKDGSVSEGYHIPGRAPIAGETDEITYNPGDTYWGGVANHAKVFQIMDTTTALDAPITKGEFGYWQNENERYPVATSDINGDFEVWDDTGMIGTLQGENVRHHKFPSPHYMYDHVTEVTAGTAATNKVLGISIDDVYIPSGMEDLVQGYFISYAKRNVEDISIFGMSDLKNWQHIYDEHQDSRHTECYRFHDLFMLSLMPDVKIDYIKAYYATGSTGIISDTVDGLYNSLLFDTYDDYGYNIDIIKETTYVNADNVAFIDSVYNIPQTTNQYREGVLALRAKYTKLATAGTWQKPYLTDYKATETFPTWETKNYVVGGIYSYKTDVFTSFFNQTPISTGYFFPITSPGLQSPQSTITVNGIIYNLCGGDTFLSNQEYAYKAESGITPGSTITFTAQGVCRYSPVNYQFRLEPSTGFLWGGSTIEWNDYLYDNNWTLLFQLKALFSYDFNIPYVSTYPYRIARSLNEQLDSLEERLRTFIYSDYYEQPKDKGYINVLESLGNTLVIQHLYTLYLAKAKENMTVDGQDVGLAQRDIFDNLPTEVYTSDHGTIGNQSMFAAFSSVIGYLTVDRKKGCIYLVNQEGGVEEVSDVDTGFWFEKNLNTVNDIDSPYLFNGIVATYDNRKKHRRIIISKKEFDIPLHIGYDESIENTYNLHDLILKDDGIYEVILLGNIEKKEPPVIRLINEFEFSVDLDSHIGNYGFDEIGFTISYSLYSKAWCSFHDYHPKALFTSRDKLYGALDNIYEHNDVTTKCKFYPNGIICDSFIDVLNNNGNTQTKLLKFTSWLANAYYENVFRYDMNIDKIMAYNDTQCSDLITLNDLPDYFSTNVEKTIYGISHFKEFYDCVINNRLAIFDKNKSVIATNVSKLAKDYFDLSYFISTFVVIRLLIDNTAILNSLNNPIHKEVVLIDNKCTFNNSTI